MALKAKSSDTDEFSDDEDSKDEVLHHQVIQEVHKECQWEGLRQGP